MAKVIQRRRGTSTEHNTFTGALAELTVDTTKNTVVVHDGATTGGIPLSREDLANAKTTALPTITGSGTEANDVFLMYDTSAGLMKAITREELNNAMEIDDLSNVTITGGTINGTVIGGTTAAAGSFTTVAASSTVTGTKLVPTGNIVTGNGMYLPTTNTLAFSTNGAERVRVDASGNVGIGTSSPTSPDGTTAGNPLNGLVQTIYGPSPAINLTASSGTGWSLINFGRTGGTTNPYRATIGYEQAADALVIGAGGGIERMRITSGGNVGIGTSSPTLGKLQLGGVVGTSVYVPTFRNANSVTQRGYSAIYSGSGAGVGGTIYSFLSDINLGNSEVTRDVRAFFANFTGGGSSNGGTNYAFRGDFAVNTATTTYGIYLTGEGRNYFSGNVGIGTTSPSEKLHVVGDIVATGNITAYFSDDRLKTKLGEIENALEKICSLSGFYYEANETAQSLGYKPVREVGVSAQSVQKILPEAVKPAPIDKEYLAVQYEKMIPLLIEAIKELNTKIDKLAD